MSAPGAYRVAVVGGGWAGCTAAVELAQAGVQVTLYEQASVLGGRARRLAIEGRSLDNGQHLLIGAYRDTVGLLERLGTGGPPTLRRAPLRLEPFGTAPHAVRLSAPRLRAPWHLLAAVMLARNLTWHERMAIMRDFRRLERAGFECDAALTVSTAFAGTPRRAFDALWAPLCIAALNTPPERASARMFARVLAGAFAGDAHGSDFLLPDCDLSALLPEPAARFVSARGGAIVMGTRVSEVRATERVVEIASARGSDMFDAAVIAVAPHQLARLSVTGAGENAADALRKAVAAFTYEPITTVYLAYARVACPAIARLDDAPGQWVFERGMDADGAGRVLSVVVSASGPHERLTHEELAQAVDAQLRRFAPDLAPPRWSKVIAERRATYACVPNLRRPSPGRFAPRLHLVGDYTDQEYPATLEAAVRSGLAGARTVLAERGAS